MGWARGWGAAQNLPFRQPRADLFGFNGMTDGVVRRRYSMPCAASQRSASMAAMQPLPAAVTA